MRALLTILLTVVGLNTSWAQRSFGVAFYDVEGLYDTIPSQFYDDSDYTPEGRLRWDTERYRLKVEHTVSVIDSMAMPVVALWGVENEQVVRDIVTLSRGDYAYVHRTHDYSNGLDFALLYYGDRLFTERITPWRGALCVECEIDRQKVAIVIVERCTSLGVLLSQMQLRERGYRIIVVGESSRQPLSRFSLTEHTTMAERAGRGNMMRSGAWTMRDRMASTWAEEVRCDVYIKGWMLDKEGKPLPTIDRQRYYGGYSSALPIFGYFFHY